MVTELLSRGQRHYKRVAGPTALTQRPTGVWEYKRVELHQILPQLGTVPLSVYYQLRIACCAHLMVAGEDKLEDCERCNHNQGFVCPFCLGATWLSRGSRAGMVRCLRCCLESIGDKNQIVTAHDPQKELLTVQAWLARKFPYGVPHQPTEQDLLVAASL